MSTICISSHSNFANVPLWACACVTQSSVCVYMCAGFAVYVWRQWEPLHSVLIILSYPEQKAKERDIERKTKSLEQYLMVVIWIGLFCTTHTQATIGRCIEIMGFSLHHWEKPYIGHKVPTGRHPWTLFFGLNLVDQNLAQFGPVELINHCKG